MAEREAAKRLAAAAAVMGEGAPDTGSARSAIPSFIVMDVMRAALAAEVAGRSIMHMEVGQPGTPAPRAARHSGGARAGSGDARLHHGARQRCAACAHRAALCGLVRRARCAGAHRCDDWIVGGIRAGIPRHVRCRRCGGAAFARLPLLPAHPQCAGAAVGAARDGACNRLDAERPRMSCGRCAAMASRGC